MEPLIDAIQNKIPIIDHHAHNLLLPSHTSSKPFLAITSEASGNALDHAPSTLAHLRAVKQLAGVLGCKPTWEEVQARIELKRRNPEIWARRCFQGIETVLIDDGLDRKAVHSVDWHDRLTKSKCKRIVRIESLAEFFIAKFLSENTSRDTIATEVENRFTEAIKHALADPCVAGFKSVICYRTGLAIPDESDVDLKKGLWAVSSSSQSTQSPSFRLEDQDLNPFFVHLTARLIEKSSTKKPFQFHTGLGDNDMSLESSSPARLQPFIKTYPTVPIVLLHAGYPFTREAGYLASVYSNVFLDIGEVFPLVSHDGQERVLREALELCPSTKMNWSTDGHWFPETYLLAVIQVKETFQKVLGEYVRSNALSVTEAVKIASDIFFNTSNTLYNLNLNPLPATLELTLSDEKEHEGALFNGLSRLDAFLERHPSVKYLRLQWLDYAALLRLRVFPVKQARKMAKEGKTVGIIIAALAILQCDIMPPGFTPVGEDKLWPDYRSLRLAGRAGYATVQGEFRDQNGKETKRCPRSCLRNMVALARRKGLEFLVGFEIEVVFMKRELIEGKAQFQDIVSQGHSWSGSRPLHDNHMTLMVETILERLEASSIELQQMHPESASGQFEFVLSPLEPLTAVDTLLAARDIISTTAAEFSLRATLVPKPFPHLIGTGAHIHLSLTPVDQWRSFFAGVLKHLPAIVAFTYSNAASYDRVQAGYWAGSTYVSWGTQNREAPLRRIEGSHFEIKCCDGLANMYLAMSAILGAGLHGVIDAEPLDMQDCSADPASLSQPEREELGITRLLPRSVGEALECLQQDTQLREVLGVELVTDYVRVKEAESSMLEKMDPDERRHWLIERY